jgi:hypothetical protein
MEALAELLREELGISPHGKFDPTTGFAFSGVSVLTDYLVLVEGLALALYASCSLRATSNVQLYLICTGLGFGLAGVTHQLVGMDADPQSGTSSLLLAGAPRNFPADLLRPEAAYVTTWGLACGFNCVGTFVGLAVALQYSFLKPHCSTAKAQATAACMSDWRVLFMVWAVVFIYVASNTNNGALVVLFCGLMYVASIAVSIKSRRVWLVLHSMLACMAFIIGVFGPKSNSDYDKDFVYHVLTMVSQPVLLKAFQRNAIEQPMLDHHVFASPSILESPEQLEGGKNQTELGSSLCQ